MNTGFTLLLANEQDAERLFIDMLPWLGLLCVIVLILGVLAMWIRARLRTPGNPTGDGYTLVDLRQMHARGELSDEEFDKAREAMIAGVRGPDTPNPEESGPSEGPKTF